MNMDSSQSHHQNQNNNWLAFSLSNTNNLFQQPHATAFHHHHEGDADTRTTTHHELSVLTDGSPKLEDFLGGCGSAASTGSGPDVCHFQDESQTCIQPVDTASFYDSELKTIATSFLRGFSTDNHQQLNQQLAVVATPPQQDISPAKKAIDTFGQRTSIYRGIKSFASNVKGIDGREDMKLIYGIIVAEEKGKVEKEDKALATVDNYCMAVYAILRLFMGGYDKEDKAARAYDLAALKYWGPTTTTNFPVCNYEKELDEMKNMTRQEFVASLRRKSSGFSRGASIYRGVTRHHQHGRWQARIGRVAGTQEEAAEAYDIAAIKFRGLNAVTNFDMSRYDVNSIANKNLPIGGMCNKSKTSTDQSTSSNIVSFAVPMKQDSSSTDYWSSVLGYNQNQAMMSSYQSTTQYSMEYPSGTSTTNNEGGGFIQQENNNGTVVALSNGSVVPMGGPVGLNGSSYGNWIEQSFHSNQPAKQNLSPVKAGGSEVAKGVAEGRQTTPPPLAFANLFSPSTGLVEFPASSLRSSNGSFI
ncbi:hypothetical protein LXL04_028362 [Taraxacum kok-saghyz]